MNGLSLEHKSCCDRHGLTHGLTTHHDLGSLSTVTNFSNRESLQVEKKGISTQQSSSIQNNLQHINSNHPNYLNSIHSYQLPTHYHHQPNTSKMQFTTLAFAAFAALTSAAAVRRAPIDLCPAIDTPQCCQVDVDGVADLSCEARTSIQKSRSLSNRLFR
jgi:hypothetical protein